MTEGTQNLLMILWGGRKAFSLLLFLILKCDFPSPLAFLALCPFVCVYVLVWLSARVWCQGPWGSSLALPYGSGRALHSQKDRSDLQLPPWFLLHASRRLLCRGDAVPDKKLFSCFGAAVVPAGIPAAGGYGGGC